jgi:ribonuclease-3
MGFEKLYKKIDYKFKDPSLLKKALTHSSFVKNQQESNEVFEFLGDSIIGFYLSEKLVKIFNSLREGDLSKLKAILSSRKYLFDISKKIELGEYIFLGRGEKLDKGREKLNIVSSAFEALIAAVYIDSDLQAVNKILDKLFCSFFEELKGKNIKINDYKSEAQELFQKIWKKTPIYVVDNEMGPEHNKTFEVVMIGVNNEILVRGEGKTKKDAEQTAAKLYITTLFPEKKIIDFDDFFIEILD